MCSFCYVVDLVCGVVEFVESGYCGLMNFGNFYDEMLICQFAELFC